MKKFLMTLLGVATAIGLYAETRTIECTFESLDIDLSKSLSTKQFRQIEQDGLTLTFNAAYYPTQTQGPCFYFSGKALDETATGKPAFFGITKNTNGHKITKVDYHTTYGTTIAYHDFATASDEPTVDTSSTVNYLTPSEWTKEHGTSYIKGFVKGDNTYEFSEPAEYILFVATSSAISYIDSFTIYYEVEDENPDDPGDTRVKPTFAFANRNLSVDEGAENIDLGFSTNVPADAVVWTMTPDDGGLVRNADGTYNAISGGTYTITAEFEGNEEFKPAKATATVKVVVKATPLFRFYEDQYVYELNKTVNMGQKLEREATIKTFNWSFEPIGDSPADGLEIDGAWLTTKKDGEYYLRATFDGDATYKAAVAETKIISGLGLVTGPIEKQTPTLYFTKESVTYALGSNENIVDLLEWNDINGDDFVWSIEPVGESPADGITVTVFYSAYVRLTTVKDGEYIVKVHYPGNAKFEEADVQIRVISGRGQVSEIEKVNPNFAFAEQSLTVAAGTENISLGFTSDVDASDVVWTVTPDNGGLVRNDDGTYNAVEAGEYVVKASFAGNESYNAANASITVTVTASVEKPAPLFAFQVDEYKMNPGENFFIRNKMTLGEDLVLANITYSINALEDSPADGAELLAGYFSAKKAGTYEIIANYSGDDTYASKNATLKVIVEEVVVDPLKGTVRPQNINPADGSKIESCTGLDKIVITYPPIGEDGIDSVNRNEGVYLTLTKDGEVAEQIPTSDRSRFYISNNNYSEMNVTFNHLTTPGKYTLTIPANVLTFALGGGTLGGESTENMTAEELFQKSHNAELNISFEILYAPSWTVTPAPGRVKADALKKVEFTYPEDVTVAANPSAISQIVAPSLYFFDASVIEGDQREDENGNKTGEVMHQKTKIAEYEVAYNGNKVTLTLPEATGIATSPESTAVKYYYIAIPNGYWIAEQDGNKYNVVGQNLEKYSVEGEAVVEPVADVPYLNIAENSAVTLDDFRVLKLHYPEGYSFNAWATSNPMGKKLGFVVANLKQAADATSTGTTSIADYSLTEIDEANRVLTLTLKDKHNVELTSGYYCVSLTTNLFVMPGNKKSSFIYFKGYDFTAGERLNAGFSMGGEFEIHAAAPGAENVEELKVAVTHHAAYGETPDVHYHSSLVSMNPHADHASGFDMMNYTSPSLTFGATEDPTISHIGIKASTAGVYELRLNKPASIFFEAEEAKAVVTVRPTFESLGLGVNGTRVAANEDDEYEVSFCAENDEPVLFDFAQLVGTNPSAKVWYKVVDADPSALYRVESREVATEGYTLFGEGENVDLDKIVARGQKRVLSVMVEHNNVVSAPKNVTVVNNGVPSGVETVGSSNGDVKWYDLQGQAVANPENGVYIRVEGGKAVKVVR